MEFEFAYYDVAVQHIGHYTTETPLRLFSPTLNNVFVKKIYLLTAAMTTTLSKMFTLSIFHRSHSRR